MKKYILILIALFIQFKAEAQMASNTEIQLDPNYAVPMNELYMGASVLRSNQTQKKLITLYVDYNEQAMIYIKTVEGNYLIADKNQILQLANKKFVRAKAVKSGDELVGLNGTLHVAQSSMIFYMSEIALLALEKEVIHPERHLFYANGFVVGDYTLQTNSKTK